MLVLGERPLGVLLGSEEQRVDELHSEVNWRVETQHKWALSGPRVVPEAELPPAFRSSYELMKAMLDQVSTCIHGEKRYECSCPLGRRLQKIPGAFER